MKEFEIWEEGFIASGEWGRAKKLGVEKANTFKEAALKFALKNGYATSIYGGDFDAEDISSWGCKWYDNEEDARKLNG